MEKCVELRQREDHVIRILFFFILYVIIFLDCLHNNTVILVHFISLRLFRTLIILYFILWYDLEFEL